MSVGSFDPGANTTVLTPDLVAELVAAAGKLETENFGFDPERLAELAAVSRHDADCDWSEAVKELPGESIVALIQLFTLAERLPGWEAGARSPVIPLAATLKKRGEYPDDLTPWIKANSENRFLPYGSLMDRL